MTDERASEERKEWNAAAYHVLSEPQFAWGLRVLERIPLAGDEHVLDAGCGSGRLTGEVGARLRNGFVIGCDLSENMAQAAVRTLASSRVRGIVCADLSALPFARAFDLIFSTATFHWIRDHDRLFAELRRTLRADGRMEAQCGGGANLAAIHARADALAFEQPFRAHFGDWEEPWRFASPVETEDSLRRAGFASARCWLEHTPITFADAARFGAFIESVVLRPYLAHLESPELRRRFLETMVRQAAKDNPPYTLDYWRLNISAATI
jgi:trans-aconitate 2-methyltransferase